MEPQNQYVLRTVEERGVRLVRLWFTDVVGQLKSFAISPAELENAFEEGMHFDGSSIDGFSRVQESDVLAKPDPSTFELLPWSENDETSARMFCDISNLDGSPFEGDPRHVLKRNLDRARERGFSFYVAPEMEFFYFADGDPSSPPIPLDTGSYFDLTTADVASDLRKRTIHTLEALGIPVEYSFHEDSPSQHEIDLRYTGALSMADNVMTFRLVVREIAMERGFYATFMPKPLPGVQGSGMHTHLSLFEGDTNAFSDPADPYRMSKVGRAFVAGLLHHAPEITAVTNQLVNSYKRLIVGTEAPAHVSWAPQQPLGPGAGAGGQGRQGVLGAHRVPGSRPGLQPLPRLLAAAGGRPEGPRGGLRAPARGHQQRVRPHAGRAGRRRHARAAPVVGRRARRHGGVRAGRRGPRGAHLRVVPAQQAPGVGRLQGPGHPVRAEPLPASMVTMEPLLVHPDPPPPELVQCLDLGGYRWKAVGEESAALRLEPDAGWGGAVLVVGDDPELAFNLCRSLRKRDMPLEPLMLLVSGARLHLLTLREELYDDFCLHPFHPASSRPACATCSGAPARAPHPSWSSTPASCSTWRPTRPSSTVAPST